MRRFVVRSAVLWDSLAEDRLPRTLQFSMAVGHGELFSYDRYWVIVALSHSFVRILCPHDKKIWVSPMLWDQKYSLYLGRAYLCGVINLLNLQDWL